MARGTCSLHAFNESPDDEGEPGTTQRSVDCNLREDAATFQSPTC